MLYCVGLRTPADQVALAFYVLCGLTRLARFNIVAHLVPKNAFGKASYIEGLPTPYAALTISTTVAIFAWMDWISQAQALTSMFHDTFYEVHWAIIPVVILSAAMASKRLRVNFGALSIPATTAAIFITCWWISSV
jgi:CDP-diacylglycerol---serine O-phosphatidyltransferase